MRISRMRGTEKESEKKRNRTKNKRWTTTATTMNDNDKETFNYPIMKNAFIATTTTQYIFPFTISALGKYWFAASLSPIFSLFSRYFSLLSTSCLDSFVALAHKCRPYIYTGNGYT